MKVYSYKAYALFYKFFKIKPIIFDNIIEREYLTLESWFKYYGNE